MFTKLICAVLIVSTTQAFPATSNTEDEDKKEVDCLLKKNWYKTVSYESSFMYHDWHKKLSEISVSGETLEQLSKSVSTWQTNKFDETLKEYDAFFEKSTVTEELCPHLDIIRKIYVNLTEITITLKTDMIKLAKDLGVPSEKREVLRKFLSKPVNFLLTTGLTENGSEDLDILEEKVEKETNNGYEMEKHYKFNENGELEFYDDKRNNNWFSSIVIVISGLCVLLLVIFLMFTVIRYSSKTSYATLS